MTPDQVVAQFQQILSTMQRIVNASSDLADRVDGLEQNSGELLGKLTDIQGNLQLLLEKQTDLQKQVLQDYELLEARVRALEVRGS